MTRSTVGLAMVAVLALLAGCAGTGSSVASSESLLQTPHECLTYWGPARNRVFARLGELNELYHQEPWALELDKFDPDQAQVFYALEGLSGELEWALHGHDQLGIVFPGGDLHIENPMSLANDADLAHDGVFLDGFNALLLPNAHVPGDNHASWASPIEYPDDPGRNDLAFDRLTWLLGRVRTALGSEAYEGFFKSRRTHLRHAGR